MMTLRLVWREVRRNPLFASIYIFGTALALCSTTVMVAILNTMLMPIYPEFDRNRTGYITQCLLTVPEGSYQYGFSYDMVKEHLYTLDKVDKVTAYIGGADEYAQSATGGLDVPVHVKPVDTAFFDVFRFKFLAGKPFSTPDMESGLPVAVLGDRTARRIFGNTPPEELIGRTVSVGYRNFTISGIVLEATELEKTSYAGVYYPYTAYEGFDAPVYGMPVIGYLRVLVIADDLEPVKKQLEDIATRFNNSNKEYSLDFGGGPYDHIGSTLDPGFGEKKTKLRLMFMCFGLIILGLLIVPGLNLSGLISGRLESRVGEMGIRKSFGATRTVLMKQVLWENLVLTAAGTVLGYFFAYCLLKVGIGSIFSPEGSSIMSHGMMSAPLVFIMSAVLCLILNVLAGIVPVFNSLRRPIVQSLKEN